MHIIIMNRNSHNILHQRLSRYDAIKNTTHVDKVNGSDGWRRCHFIEQAQFYSFDEFLARSLRASNLASGKSWATVDYN